MAFPSCKKCGHRFFRTHEKKAGMGDVSFLFVMCAKPDCGEIVGTVSDNHALVEGLAIIDGKLNRIMKALNLDRRM